MAKKSKTRQSAALAPAAATAKKSAAKPTGTKKVGAKKGPGVKKVASVKKGVGVKKVGAKKGAAGGKKRAATHLRLPVPIARARKLSGDLYQSASLAIWSEAIERAPEHERATLIQLQDAICDAADLLRLARATNPKHLRLFCVACFDRGELPTTTPRFVAAASAEDALEIWRAAFKGETGAGKPQARLVPELTETPGMLE
jgi:hypothetical protein